MYLKWDGIFVAYSKQKKEQERLKVLASHTCDDLTLTPSLISQQLICATIC